jgi:hypothetical protein
MRRYSFILTVIIFTMFIASCSHLTDLDGDDYGFSQIYGIWVETGFEDSLSVFRKSAKLDDNLPGFIIHQNGRFIKRQNSGWCGTPPISYANYEGEWVKLSDSLIDITVDYWGGTTSYQMEIVSLSSGKMKILYHY